MVDMQKFEELVAAALDEIPAALWRYIENVDVVVQEWPSRQQPAPALHIGSNSHHLKENKVKKSKENPGF